MCAVAYIESMNWKVSHLVQLEDRLSACVSEETDDFNLGDMLFKNNDIVDVERGHKRFAVGSDKSDLGDECIEP
jgi:hypothetical protein